MEILDLEQDQTKREPNILTFRKQLEWIAYNYKLSKHAEMQLIRRDTTDNDSLKNRILSSPLAWRTKDDCLAIAFNLYTYIVVSIKEEQGENVPVVVTFIDTRSNSKKTNDNVIDAFLMDYKAKCRELGV